MPIKGMHDIKTHVILSREGKLFSVAKNLHRVGRREISNDNIGAWDGSVVRNVFDKKSVKTETKVRLAKVVPFLFYQVGELTEELLDTIENDIKEMTYFAAEGLLGAKEELERLCQRFLRVKTGRI